MDHIDVIFYINLQHRHDRRQQFEQEIAKFCTDASKIKRIEAFHTPTNGALGCAMSHYEALEQFSRNSEWNTCAIFEDDFEFLHADVSQNNETICNVITEFPNWNAISLTYNPDTLKYTETHLDGIIKVASHRTTAGYIIKKGEIVDSLMKCYKTCIFNLRKLNLNISYFNIDQKWEEVQEKFSWYAPIPPVGKTSDGYSDICGMNIKYDLWDKFVR